MSWQRVRKVLHSLLSTSLCLLFILPSPPLPPSPPPLPSPPPPPPPVGYSTCHWCHVMERESFESQEIGTLLGRYFVSIKVDREERPDVDRVYMTYIQVTEGGGGWPMSVFLTPDLKPFLGGTYFPPQDSFMRPGFATVLRSVAKQVGG